MFPTALGKAGTCLHRDAVRELGRYRVRTAVSTGEFSSPWPGVLIDPFRAAEPLTVVTAAWLTSGRDAVVAGETAAFLHGITAAEPTPVHVMAPYESRKRSRPGIVVHNGTGLNDDLVVVHDLPVLCLERVLTDLVCTVSPARALAVVDQALAALAEAAGEALRARVAQRLRHRPDPRGTRVGARLVELASGRAESPAESWLRWRIVDLGFPPPEVNHWVCDLDGRHVHRVDLSWPSLRIAVEYLGYAAHAGRAEQDAARVRDLERRDWIVVEVSAPDLGAMTQVERDLLAAFRDRGVILRDRMPGTLRPRRHRERWAS